MQEMLHLVVPEFLGELNSYVLGQMKQIAQLIELVLVRCLHGFSLAHLAPPQGCQFLSDDLYKSSDFFIGGQILVACRFVPVRELARIVASP